MYYNKLVIKFYLFGDILKALRFIKKNIVFCIAFFAATVTCFFVLPDKEYLGYFDWKTLSCLFLTLAVVCALRNIKFFTILARKLVTMVRNLRSLFLVLIIITFIGSMIIANDMALITFLPLGYFALSVTKQEKYMAYLFVLQNISANLGGMLTPFGNPQNLYLYSKFNIPDGEFVRIMFPPFILAIALITLCCLIFVKKEALEIEESDVKLPIGRVAIYLALFAVAIMMVFRFMPYQVGLIIIPLALIFLDKKALMQVDYGLLFTFVFFFIFAGNMGRIDAVRDFFSYLLNINTLVFSALSCQVISNVPSAILLSQFTDNYRELLLGVNIGGAGTLIASLASLITFKEYTKQDPDHVKQYVVKFSLFNFGFLITLTLFCLILL